MASCEVLVMKDKQKFRKNTKRDWRRLIHALRNAGGRRKAAMT